MADEVTYSEPDGSYHNDSADGRFPVAFPLAPSGKEADDRPD
ncbi:hypothetical protein [Sphingomonas sp. HDW15A]|nr:hypothetical protein [Sphingomonas sp. HDW15A]